VVGWLLTAVPPAPAFEIDGSVVADGKRWAAWSPAPGTAVVLDDRSGTRRRLSIPPCPLGGVGGGWLLLTCSDPVDRQDDPVLVDVRTGQATNVGGDDLKADALDFVRFTGVGAHGILVTVDGYHHEDVYAFDWRSRKRHDLDDRRRTVDLDRPALTRPLCAPVERSVDPWAGDPYVNGPPYLPIASEGRWAAELATRRNGPGAVRLWRCGQRRPRVLERCHCRDVSAGAGMVAWQSGRARALDLASGRRRSWRSAGEGYARVAQAGRTLLLWTQRSTDEDPPATLKIVRWPRRGRR
jgi:hypothetical protein